VCHFDASIHSLHRWPDATGLLPPTGGSSLRSTTIRECAELPTKLLERATVERATGIEPAFSAWEAAALLEDDLVKVLVRAHLV
jgi:hypothetical protein